MWLWLFASCVQLRYNYSIPDSVLNHDRTVSDIKVNKHAEVICEV